MVHKQEDTCCVLYAACCMCTGVHRIKGPEETKEETKEKDEKERRQKEGGGQRHKKREDKKQEQRRLQLACREHHKKGEPHAPTQRRPTSMNTADWSAKLREKARKKKGEENSNGHFKQPQQKHTRAMNREPCDIPTLWAGTETLKSHEP